MSSKRNDSRNIKKTQPVFVCSKPTVETLEKGIKSLESLILLWCLYC